MKPEIRERIEKIKTNKIPTGYKKSKFGIVPLEWNEVAIDKLVREKKEICSDEKIPLYSLTIESGVIPKSERYEREHLVKDTESAYKYIGNNEFAYNPMNARFGAIARLKENKIVKVSKYYNVFEVEKTVDLNFFEFLIKSKRALNSYDEISTGTLEEKKRVHFGEFAKILIPFPKREEQEKISNILMKWDEGITKQEQLLEGKREYKRGMMQKIFSQELRFKDENGNEYPEWEEKSLGDACEINPKNIDLPEEFVYIDLESVEKGMLRKENIILKKEAPSRAQRILQNGDILYQTVRPYQKNNYYFNKENQEYFYVASTGYAQMRTLENSRYLYQFIHTDNFVDDVLERCTGTSYPSINSTDLKTMKIDFPSLPEQQKIADLFTTIDREIELLERELELLKTEKQSLMSLLFSGIVRV